MYVLAVMSAVMRMFGEQDGEDPPPLTFLVPPYDASRVFLPSYALKPAKGSRRASSSATLDAPSAHVRPGNLLLTRGLQLTRALSLLYRPGRTLGAHGCCLGKAWYGVEDPGQAQSLYDCNNVAGASAGTSGPA